MKELDEATSLARNREYSRAFEICDSYIQSNPNSSDGFRTRSKIYARKGVFREAVNDITNAILRSEPEPADYFFRGWWNLENGKLAASIEDLTSTITIGDEMDFHYYDESAYFFRALSFLRSNRFEEALSDCDHVHDEFLMYLTSGQVSRAQIVRDAKAACIG